MLKELKRIRKGGKSRCLPGCLFRLGLGLTIIVLATLPTFSESPGATNGDSAALTNKVLEAAGPAFEFVREGRFRGIYFAAQGREYTPELAATGINVKMPKFFCWDLDDYEEAIEFFLKGAAMAEEHGLIYLPWMNWAGARKAREVDTRFAQFVDYTGREWARTPCPLDRAYWEFAITDRTLKMARLSLTERIHGLIIDFEMYGAELIFYSHAGFLSYRDQVFADFLKARGLDVDIRNIPVPKRRHWLQEKGLLEAYRQYHQDTIKEITADIRRRVHQINPNFILGFYPFNVGDPFHHGAVLGYGTPRMPTVLLPSMTYAHGYREDLVDGVVRHLAELGAHALHVPGLWLWQFPPSSLAAHAYLCAKHAAGYWIYGPYAIFESWARIRNVQQVTRPEEFLEALRQANMEIIASLRDPAHQTHLRVDPALAVFTRVNLEKHRVPLSLVPLRPEWKVGSEESVKAEARVPSAVRKRATYILYADQGELIRLNIRCKQLGAHAAGLSFKLVSPSGKVVAEGTVGLNQTERVEITAVEPGIYLLACVAGVNAIMVSSPNRISIYAPKQRLSLMGHGGSISPLHFYVPADVEEFYIKVRGFGVERVKAALIDPDGNLIEERDNISAPHFFRARPGRAPTGRVWSLRLNAPSEGMLEDVVIRLSENLPPVLAQGKEVLLVLE